MAPIYEVSNEQARGLDNLKIGKRRFDLENKTSIISPACDLSFVTDKYLFKEFIKYANKTFPQHKDVLSNNLSFSEGVMKGSNDYIIPAFDMFLENAGSEYRIATQRELETNLQMLKEYYIDSGLALRSLDCANSEKARYLFEQFKQKGIEEKDLPLFINLKGLRLDKELNFILTDKSQYTTAECLNWEDGTSYCAINDFGLPKEVNKNSNRKIWTSDASLSGCYLLRGSVLSCWWDYLADSGGSGRVVLAKARSA